jgi:plasmid stability protein
MTSKCNPTKPGHLNIRNIPRDTLFRLKMAAAAEHRSVKDLVLELVNGKIQDLERKGLLPKGK